MSQRHTLHSSPLFTPSQNCDIRERNTETRSRPVFNPADWNMAEETTLTIHSERETAEHAIEALREAIHDVTTYGDAELLLNGFRMIQRIFRNKFPGLKEIIIDSDEELEDYMATDDDAEDGDADDDGARTRKRKGTEKGNGDTGDDGAKERKGRKSRKLAIQSLTGSDSDDGDSMMRGVTKDGSPNSRSTKRDKGELVVHRHKKTLAEQIRDVRVPLSLLGNR